jgi:hypothetical protein
MRLFAGADIELNCLSVKGLSIRQAVMARFNFNQC